MLNDHALLPITRHSNAPYEHVPPSPPTAHALEPRIAIIRAQGTRGLIRVQEKCARWEPATAVACGPRASPLRPRCSTRRARFLPRSAFAHESAAHVRVTGGTSLPTGCTSRHRSGRYGAHPGIAQATACRTNAILPTFPILFQRPQVDHLFTIGYTAFT